MTDAFIPHKYCNVTVALQIAKDAEAGTAYKLPLPEGTDLTNNKNYTFFQYSGGHYGPKHYETGGTYMEGTLRIPFIPGYVAAGDLYTWIWGRTSEATYFQTNWATITRDLGHTKETYTNCKVMGGTIAVDYAGNYVSLDLNVAGIAEPTPASVDGDESLFTTRPYRYKETTLETAEGGTYGVPGAVLAGSNVTRNHSLEFNNMNEAPGDMGTLQNPGSTYPYDLPSSAKAVWTGSFDRIYANSDIYDAFMGGEECAYVLTMASVLSDVTCTFTMPRIVYTEDPLNAPDSGIVRESVSFQALEKQVGVTVTDACVVAEAAS